MDHKDEVIGHLLKCLQSMKSYCDNGQVYSFDNCCYCASAVGFLQEIKEVVAEYENSIFNFVKDTDFSESAGFVYEQFVSFFESIVESLVVVNTLMLCKFHNCSFKQFRLEMLVAAKKVVKEDYGITKEFFDKYVSESINKEREEDILFAEDVFSGRRKLFGEGTSEGHMNG